MLSTRGVIITLALHFLASSLAAAEEPKPDEAKPVTAIKAAAEEPLNGKWRLVERKGKPFPNAPTGKHWLTITGGTFKVAITDLPTNTLDMACWAGHGDGTLTLDAKSKPAHLDTVFVHNPTLTWFGIYQLDGDKLTLAVRTGERPKNFDDMERTTLMTFERVKK